tara:strand:+ start:388 stop:1323 length:936 start_codon:yes stop_codon:yes gene_type:complete
MNKKVNLIIGTGVLGAYLSSFLLNKNEKVIVTSRSLKKKVSNYYSLKIKNKIKLVKLNVNNKKQIEKIIEKYSPKKIFYFSGQSSITKSIKNKNETIRSHYDGTKNFLEIIKIKRLNLKFFKANSGYIFSPNKGMVNLKSKLSSNKNPYIIAQQKTFKLIKKYRDEGLNVFNLIFMQIESPLRPNDFFIKKVCIGAKNKKKIIVGNINTYRDYSWITDIVKAIFLTSNLQAQDYLISAGKKMSGKKILKKAYSLSNLNYKNYFSSTQKYFRTKENKLLIGSIKNSYYLKNKYNFSFKIFGDRLIEEMYKSL